MHSKHFILLIITILTLSKSSDVFAQITPEKYYKFSQIRTLKIDSCQIYKTNRDSIKQLDFSIVFDKKSSKMTLFDQLYGSKIVFNFFRDSIIKTQEMYLRDGKGYKYASVDSFFYDANGKKTGYHSVSKNGKNKDFNVRISYLYKNDTLSKETYYYEKDVVKTVYHAFDKQNNTESEITISEKSQNTNMYYKRNVEGQVIKAYSINIQGDTNFVQYFYYDTKGRNIRTVTFDKVLDIKNIYLNYYNSLGLLESEEEFLRIKGDNLASSVYSRRVYKYFTSK